MTFDEAMAKSRDLEFAVLQAIALHRPAAEQRAALSAHIQFNPFMYQPGIRELHEQAKAPHAGT